MNPIQWLADTLRNYKEPAPNVPKGESAWSADSIFMTIQGGFDRYNPDILVQRKGADVYRKMMRDDQVKAAYNLKINATISRIWRFEKQNDDPVQDEIIEFFEHNIKDLLFRTWKQALRTVMLGKAYGFSVTEKVFEAVEVDNQPRWIVRKIKAKPFYSFEFPQDEYGNLSSVIQTQGGNEKKLNPAKFIIYVNQPELDPIWGESDFRAAYRPYWEKDNILKFWNIYLERLAGGFVVAKPNERAQSLSPAERNDFQNMLKNLSANSSLMVPVGYDVDVVAYKDAKTFDDAIGNRNRAITRSLLLPDLLGMTDRGSTGSRALGDTQYAVWLNTLVEDGDMLADTMNEQLFSQLAGWNYGVTNPPKFKFEPFTQEQKNSLASIWMEAVKSGTVTNTFDDETRTRELLSYPIKTEEEIAEEPENIPEEKPEDEKPGEEETKPADAVPEEEVIEETKQSDGFGTLSTDQVHELQKAIGKIDDVKQSVGNPDVLDRHEFERLLEDTPLGGRAIEQYSKEPYEMPGDIPEGAVDLTDFEMEKPTEKFADRVDFPALEKKWQKQEDNYYDQLADSVDDIMADLEKEFKVIYDGLPKNRLKIDYVKVLKQLDNKGITVPTKQTLNRVYRSNLKDGYDLGRAQASRALRESVKGQSKDVRDRIKVRLSLTSPKLCRDKEWTVMHFVDGISLEQADSWLSKTAFDSTKDLTDSMMKDARRVLTEGLRDEIPYSETVKNLEDAFPTLIGTRSKDGTISKKANRARLSTIVRTTTTDIFTQAQLGVYRDPELGNFVQGLEYAAILDDRTTPTCNSLDGRKYPIDDPIWGAISPPNHFNCRSILIPITIVDPEVKYSGKKE